MVEDTITDGKRIAQLLASEITGLETGRLDTVSVVDADPDAMPSDTGTFAFRISRKNSELATVYLYPAYVEVQFTEPLPESKVELSSGPSQSVLQVTSGAEVKGAVDCIDDAISASQPS